jgi:hypothetical protein
MIPVQSTVGRSLIFGKAIGCYLPAVKWRRLTLKMLIAAFVFAQVAMPLLGLYTRTRHDVSGVRYSWQMFSAPLQHADAVR